MEGERRVGVAVDFSECSRRALRWAVDNVIRDGDHLVLVTICHEAFYEGGEMQLWETTGSPLLRLSDFSNPVVMKKYGCKPDPETLAIIDCVAKQKKITVLLKIYWGDPREKLCQAIEGIPLSCLVMGNRGLGPIKRVLMGSVSNFIVNNGACPITVVKNVVGES